MKCRRFIQAPCNSMARMGKGETMDLAVLTEVDVINYGTMLQSYALQKILVDSGHCVEIIRYPHRELLRQVRRLGNLSLVRAKWNSIYKKRMVKKDAFYAQYDEKKNQSFHLFREEGFLLSRKLSDRKELTQYVGEKDAVVLGSDQVWNPVNLGRDYFTMSFVPQSTRKVTYAPSFGVSSIPQSQRKRTKKYLESIDYLSVREQSGSTIIKELTGRQAQVVCDPTLLMTSGAWQKEERKAEGLPDKYIFCYFLGNAEGNRSFARELKKRTGYKIVHLPFMDELVKGDKSFGDIVPLNVGPREFLHLIHNAAYVCTDSFHATAFSLQFHRRFFSMPRTATEGKASTSSRITNLLNLVKLDELFIKNPAECSVESLLKRNAPVRWKDVDNFLKIERDKSRNYLVRALEE